MTDVENMSSPYPVVNKIILMTNFRTMYPETIETINYLNDIIQSFGFKLLLLSSTESDQIKCELIKIPFSLMDYSFIDINKSDHNSYNKNLLSIDSEFNDDPDYNYELAEQGIQKCIAAAHLIASEVKPAISFFWSGTLPQSVIFKNIFAEYFIPTYFAERGLLPESLMFDETGNGTLSKLKSVLINLNLNSYSLDSYSELKEYYLTNQIDKHEQSEFISPEFFISQKNLEGKKIIAFIGQWDSAGGVNKNYDYQSFLNSPCFKNTQEAFEYLSSVVSSLPNVVLIFKPHPFDSTNYIPSKEERIIVDKKVNIHTLLEAADTIAAMSTTVQYEALFYEKPVLLLANSFLNKLNIGYEIFCREDLEDVIQNAILEIGLEQKVENGKRFINFLANEYLISLKGKNPIKGSLRNFFSNLVTNYSLELIEPLASDKYLSVVNRLRKIFASSKAEIDETKMISFAEEHIIKNEITEAKEILLNILNNINPESVDAANSYAVTEILSGNYEGAEELLLQILAKDPANEIAIDNYHYLKQIIPVHCNTAEKINED